MCGIVAELRGPGAPDGLASMSAALAHRGPDDSGEYADGMARLAHRRLSIIDLSPAGRQPMASPDGRFHVVLNGEVYNYLELRAELGDYPYRSRTDTEAVLAAYARWGERCVEHLVGMFAFAIWDARLGRLFAARDRFGVKPLYYHRAPDGWLLVASEIKALLAAGVPARPDLDAWRDYLAHGVYDHSSRTFFDGVSAVPAGCALVAENGRVEIRRWYDLPERARAAFPDTRPDHVVADDYLARLEASVRLRFRSDVPVGVNVSGGLDSALLLALVHRVQGPDSAAMAFTFTCGDAEYDETPWVRRILERTRHPWEVCVLGAAEVPALARSIARAEDEPFGGIPTLATSLLFRRAREKDVVVLLDGQGLDEQWGGYDYYTEPLPGSDVASAPRVQGSRSPATRPDLLSPDFFAPREHVAPAFPRWSGERLLDLRLRDILHTKIPRALRFNDRVSMMHSCELREPFLDHTLVELALSQPADRLVRGGERKVLLRRMARQLVPDDLRTAPKRPLQTPQREWLAGPLVPWLDELCRGSELAASWFLPGAREQLVQALRTGNTDNSFALWQLASVALWEAEVLERGAAVSSEHRPRTE